MWVESIELKNIKSYADLKIPLERGVNFISGDNGAGKTTLLECIGLALFNCKRENRYAEYFIRNGEKEGAIRIIFHVNGACYEVERRLSLKSNGSWKAFDVSAGGKQLRLPDTRDVEAWLKSCMGIFAHLTLSRMFNDVIGVSQGMFTTPFLLPEAERKAHFNAILQVDHYKKSAERHRPVTDYLNRETALIEGNLQMLEGVEETLERMLKDGMALEAEAREKRQALEIKKKELAEAKTELTRIQERVREIDANRNDIALAEKLCATAEEKLEERKTERQQAQEAINRLKELEPKHLEYEKTERDLVHIAEQEKERRRLDMERTRVLEMRAALAGEIEARKKLEIREAAMGALAEKEKALRVREHAHAQKLAQYESLREIHGKLQKGLELLTECRESIERHETELSAVPALMERERSLGGAPVQRDEAIKEIAALKARLAQIKKDKERARDGACPIMDKRCPLVGTDLQDYLQSLEAELDQELVVREKKAEALDADVRELKKAGDTLRTLEGAQKLLRAELDKKERIIARINERLAELKASAATEAFAACFADVVFPVPEPESGPGEIKAAVHAVSDYLAEVQERLSGAGETLRKERDAFSGRLGAAIAELNAAKEVIQDTAEKLEKLMRDMPDVADALLSHEKDGMLAALGKRIEEYEETLAEFVSLDRRGSALRARKEEVQPFYEQYMENKKPAASFKQCQANVTKAEEGVLEAKKRLEELKEKGGRLTENYDEALAGRAQAHVDQLSSVFFAEQSQLAALFEKLKDHQLELDRQHGKVEKLRTLREKEGKMQKAQELLGIICNKVLRRMGERVAAVYRSRLSAKATQLYTQVARQNVELVWGEDYNIGLIDVQDGMRRIRSFRQLSGGEQMTAALAVRLGLLSQLSEVSMVCFDEPTTNLDRRRREGLSEMIPRLTENFEQVLVISHDDTFDSITEHAVRLVREHPWPTALQDV